MLTVNYVASVFIVESYCHCDI